MLKGVKSFAKLRTKKYFIKLCNKMIKTVVLHGLQVLLQPDQHPQWLQTVY